ncbi:MAG: hypothetical protein PHO10_06590 [Gemmiger sp.]|nr:hypothetical protein [Gemmiger sp.]
MRSRGGLFWQSLFLTLLLLLPMVGGVWFFSVQRQQQQRLQQVAAGKSGVTVEPGSQNTLRLLVAIQGETPAFLLVRLDAPARSITFCGLPEQTLVDAPAGKTTLAACYMAAGPARAAQLLGGTLGLAPDGYFAATAATLAALAGADTAARFDTAAVLSAAQRKTLGYTADPVAELTAANAEDFVLAARAAALSAAQLAELRAAVWAALLRQNPAVLPALPEAMRSYSARTLTDLDAQSLLSLQDTANYLQKQAALTVEYTVLPGTEVLATGEYLPQATAETARALLG